MPSVRTERRANPAALSQRVLVAEDSSVTQDLLKLLLTQRGHQVDIAVDGEQALEALQQNSYDVALLDFHLPNMDGLQVAATYRSSSGGGNKPRFIAITADVQGLLAHSENCENFDQVLPKPLDVFEVCNAIEESSGDATKQRKRPEGPSATAPAAKSVASKPPPEAAAAPSSQRQPSQIQTLGYEFLRWPDDFDATRLSARGMQATFGGTKFDAILVQEPATVRSLALVWQKKHLHVLPIIDLAETLGPAADLDGSKLAYADTQAVARLIEGFHERRTRIHRDLLFTNELGHKLLGRIFVSNSRLKAAYDPGQPGLVCYNTVLEEGDVRREAEALCDSGFLLREFFDRLQVCDRCGSSRFNVREECAACRSSDLTEEAYLHHYKCAYQGPESDFRQGETLTCPKCRRELTHFSVDYDKPGFTVKCSSCGHTASDATVGFICLDCGSHADGAAIRTRDVYSYALTDQALAFMEIGQAYLGPAQRMLRFSELPLELVVALNGEAKRYNEDHTPFALLNISYQNAQQIERQHGPRQFDQARQLFLQNLRNAVSKEGLVVEGHSYDFALLKGASPDEVRESLDELSGEANESLRLDLGATMHVFGPEDFA